MNRIFYFILFLSLSSLANEEITVHSHYAKWHYYLNSDYPNVEIEINLDKESDNAKSILVNFNGGNIQASSNELSLLKNIELGTLQATYGSFCEKNWNEPFEISEEMAIKEESEIIGIETYDCILLKVRAGWQNRELHINEKIQESSSFAIKIIPKHKIIKVERYDFPW